MGISSPPNKSYTRTRARLSSEFWWAAGLPSVLLYAPSYSEVNPNYAMFVTEMFGMAKLIYRESEILKIPDIFAVHARNW